jgi:hypothetical protein
VRGDLLLDVKAKLLVDLARDLPASNDPANVGHESCDHLKLRRVRATMNLRAPSGVGASAGLQDPLHRERKLLPRRRLGLQSASACIR